MLDVVLIQLEAARTDREACRSLVTERGWRPERYECLAG
jgi:hypothetical protein